RLVVGNKVIVDVEVKTRQASDRDFVNYHVIKSVITADTLPPAHQFAVHQGTRLHAATAINYCLKRWIEVRQGNFGKKAQRPEIHSQHRNFGLGDSPSC